MPLQKQTLKILFGGLEQDVVAKLVQPGATLELENMVWDHQGNAVKRGGSVELATSTVPAGATLGHAWALGTHQGNLVRLQRQGAVPPLLVWDPDHSVWLAPTTGNPNAAGASPLTSWLRGTIGTTVSHAAVETTFGHAFSFADVSIGNGYLCVSFAEDLGGGSVQLHQMLIDKTTGRAVVDRVVPIAGTFIGPHPRVMVVGARACFVYNYNGDLTIDVFDLTAADPTTPAGTIISAGEVVVGDMVDLQVVSTFLIVGYNGQSGQFRAARINPSTLSVVSIASLKTSGAGAIVGDHGFAWVQNLDGVTWNLGYPDLVIRNSTGGVKEYRGWTTSGGNNISTLDVTVDAADTTQAPIAAGTNGTGTGNAIPTVILYQGLTPGTEPAIKRAGVAAGGAVLLNYNALEMHLSSRLFRDAGGMTCYVGAYGGLGQETYFVLPARTIASISPGNSAFPAPLARFEVDNAVGGSIGIDALTGIAIDDANTLWLSVRNASLNVDLVKMQFRNGVEPTLPAPIFGTPVEAIESMWVPGGQLAGWDGRTYATAGFAYFPDSPNVSGTLSSGGLTADGLYTYATLYAYTDAQGRITRSEPSISKQFQLTGGATQTTVGGKYLELVDRQGVRVEIYRDTQQQPGLLRLLTTFANVHDDPSNILWSYTDSISDATLGSAVPIYTTGNVLANQAIPGFTVLAIFDDRLWGVSADDPQTLWYSDVLTPPGVGGTLFGAGLKFNQDLTLDVRDDRGPVTALALVDGQFCAFKHDSIYNINGTGPDGTGQGATYQAQRMSASVGCDNPRSVVAAFDGIWFRSSSSRAGIWRLDRGTSLGYVGTGVRSYNGLTIAGAISIPELSQLRFPCFDGSAGRWLVYDVVTQQWSTFTSPSAETSAACAVAWNGGATWACEGTQAGIILTESQSAYADGTVAFGQRAVSPWLALGDVRGFQRLYRYQGIGNTVASHLLTVNLYRDDNDADQVFAGTPFNMIAFSQPMWDWELKKPEKLSSVKVELIGGATFAAAPTAGFALTGIALVVGVKIGLAKVDPLTKRIT